jgi:hypothetical protein
MVFAHLITTPDITTADGRPIVDTSSAGGNAVLYYPALQGMTTDLHNAFYGKASANPNFAGVAPVGDAFQRAVDEGLAKAGGFYKADGTYDESTSDPINLWWLDRTHASKYGSYLGALVLFATITGRNPLSLGAGEQAAADLGIPANVAVQLQRIAQSTVAPDAVAPVTSALASPLPNAKGWNNTDVTVSLSATDNTNGSGVKQISYSTTGAQVGTGIVAADHASLTIAAEGETKISYLATDNAGNAETARTLTVLIDKTPPAISGMPAAGCNLWPPNHKLVQVARIAGQDGLSGLSSFDVDVTSSEPPNPGEKDTLTVGTGLEPRTLSLRAERQADKAGRVYAVSAVAADHAGNTATASATCIVPHDRGD